MIEHGPGITFRIENGLVKLYISSAFILYTITSQHSSGEREPTGLLMYAKTRKWQLISTEFVFQIIGYLKYLSVESVLDLLNEDGVECPASCSSRRIINHICC